MNVSPYQQIIGNICVGFATIIFLFPLQCLMRDYARKNHNNDSWATPVIFILIPLWLLLMGALLCVTASGGFAWLRLGQSALYILTVAATLALAIVMFVFIALYIRPGFTPRSLYSPVIYLVPLSTALLVILSLNPKLASGIPIQYLRWPWTIFAVISLVTCVGFFGFRIVRMGVGGVTGIVHRIQNPSPSTDAILAKFPTLDPQRDFEELLTYARPGYSRTVRETVTAHLRTSPAFIESLAAILISNSPDDGLSFLFNATLTPDESTKLALPSCTAMERFISDIPAPNYMTSDRRMKLMRWGRKTFPVIIEKFSGMDVDFSRIMPDFENALRLDDTRSE
jgi:hypothetical protein